MSGLRPEAVIVLTDTREQSPFDLSPLRQESATLTSGDYVLAADPTYAVVERKSGPDLLACIGRERSRFEKELARLKGFSHRTIVVETGWDGLLNDTRTRLTQEQITGTIAAWHARYCGFMFASTREFAQDFTRRFLFNCARKLWAQGEAFRREVEHGAG